jgi:hypothetical protein
MTIVINTAIARKRRKQKMESHRFTVSDTDSSSCREHEEEPAKRRRLDENARRKYQNRYEPEVPMTKEELAEWRREARKKRNRESAAASRNKVRNRITELEDEVKDWESKYRGLMTRIQRLEENLQEATPSNHILPSQSLNQSLVSPHISPQGLRTFNQDSALPLFPLLNNSQRQVMNGSSTLQGSNNQEHHVIEMTSLPAEKRHL